MGAGAQCRRRIRQSSVDTLVDRDFLKRKRYLGEGREAEKLMREYIFEARKTVWACFEV